MTTQKINREYDDTKLREEIEKKISVEKNQSEDLDELFDEAVKVVLNEKQASISLLQRRLKIGYARREWILPRDKCFCLCRRGTVQKYSLRYLKGEYTGPHHLPV